MRKNFYIFRHGETDLNKQKRWQGSGMNYDLNETGVLQAQDLLEKLRDKNLQIIFSSPLIRAKHTAEVTAQALDLKIVVRDNLKECFYGDAEGQLIADLAICYPVTLNNWYSPDEETLDIRFPNGESKREARDRVLAELHSLVNEPYDNIGIAIHGGTMGQLLNYFKVPYDRIPNCGAFKLVYENGEWFAEGGLF